MYKKRKKNEIIEQCTQCDNERIVAYWDEELEHYIYLCDEPTICRQCATLAPVLSNTHEIEVA